MVIGFMGFGPSELVLVFFFLRVQHGMRTKLLTRERFLKVGLTNVGMEGISYLILGVLT